MRTPGVGSWSRARLARWWAVLVWLVLLSGCSDSVSRADGDVAYPARPSGGRCHGVGFDQVSGKPPPYGARGLQRYPVDGAVCAAYWIPQASHRFVPQSLAVDGGRAFVSGYRWNKSASKRACQIAVIDLESGRETAFQSRFEAPIYHPVPTYCRHGGGAEITRDGLWVQETERLWLLDPDKIGHGDPVVRWWRMGSWMKGSSLVIRGDRLGVASHRTHARGRLVWFERSDLLAPGVRDMVPAGGPLDPATQARPVAQGRVPVLLQGVTAHRGRLWFSSSRTRCGQLTRPGGRRVDFVPGGEDIQFVGRDLWTVSEAGAEPYVDRGEALVPMLLRLDARTVLRGRAACRL